MPIKCQAAATGKQAERQGDDNDTIHARNLCGAAAPITATKKCVFATITKSGTGDLYKQRLVQRAQAVAAPLIPP